jgi:hypothetical protein
MAGDEYSLEFKIRKRKSFKAYTDELAKLAKKTLDADKIEVRYNPHEDGHNWIDVDFKIKRKKTAYLYLIIKEYPEHVTVSLWPNKQYGCDEDGEWEEYEGYIPKFMEMAFAVCNKYPIKRGIGLHDANQSLDVNLFEKNILFPTMFFGKEDIKRIGKKKILSMPVGLVKEMKDCIMVRVERNDPLSAKLIKMVPAARSIGFKVDLVGSYSNDYPIHLKAPSSNVEKHVEKVTDVILKTWPVRKKDIVMREFCEEDAQAMDVYYSTPAGRHFIYTVMFFRKEGYTEIDLIAEYDSYLEEMSENNPEYKGYTERLLKLAEVLRQEYGEAELRGGRGISKEKDRYGKIYSFNFFGKDSIKKIGKKKLLSTPADVVKEIKSGLSLKGIFIQIDQINPLGARSEYIEEAAKHLGVKSGEKWPC